MILRDIKVFLSDMDGTFYLGNRPLQGALKFAEILKEQGKKLYFLTNNSSHRATFYAEKLRNMGLSCCAPEHIITSTDSCIFHLQKAWPGARVFLLSTREVSIDFLRAGFTVVEENPDIVVLCFDKTLTYEKLARACNLIRRGVPFFATHPDFNCPTESDPLIDMGSIIEAIKASTGKVPRHFGKPCVEMVEYALWRTKAKKEEMAIIGDRLYTDIAMGKQAGVTTILLFTGETKRDDLEHSPWQPDLVFSSLEELADVLRG
jgi:4-nitrophenyl phosphatase/NagD protein